MEFWSNIFHETSCNTILELASGTGRLTHIFLNSGASYTGLEICSEFVGAAQKKFDASSKNIAFICGNMCDFNLNKQFDLIFIGFNSFLHLLTDNDVASFFDCIKKHMHENSRFIIDIYIPHPLFLYRPDNTFFHVLEYRDSITKEHIFVEETNIYDKKTDINEISWYFSTKINKHFDKKKFYVRMYFPAKMNQLLIDAGFKIINQWGDYNRSTLNVDSKLQIYDVAMRGLNK